MGRFIRTLLFCLVAGIVGPIFLVASYFIGADAPWMFWTGLAITVADVVAAVAITAARARSAQLVAAGTYCLAEVTGIEETSVMINDQPVMKVTLVVSVPEADPVRVTERIRVPRMSQSLLTSPIVVVFNRERGKVVVDWQATALAKGVVPMRFTSLEDQQTYDVTGDAPVVLEVIRALHAAGLQMSGELDLRPHPEVRAKVMQIVRQAGFDRQLAAGASDSPSPTGTITARLVELDGLLARGAITPAEHAAHRTRILGSL